MTEESLGIPVEFISCPGCGNRYRQGGLVCVNCEECKTCHDGRCKQPEYRKVDDDFLREMAEKA